MGFDLGGILGGLFGGAKNLVGGAATGVGNFAKGLFGQGGSDIPKWNTRASGLTPGYQSGSGGGGGFMNSLGGGINKMFGGGQGLGGLATMGLSSMIPNAKAPPMPAEFTNYMNQLNQGGTPGMQQAGNYYQGLMSADMNDPYIQSLLDPLNQAEEEDYQKRTAMYKSLRPGSDPMSDAAWARDEADAKSRFALQKTYAVANAKNTAAGNLNQQGNQLLGLQGSGVQQYVDQIAQQWGMNQSQRQALRESMMGLGGKMITGPMDTQNQMNWFQKMAEMQKQAGIK